MVDRGSRHQTAGVPERPQAETVGRGGAAAEALRVRGVGLLDGELALGAVDLDLPGDVGGVEPFFCVCVGWLVGWRSRRSSRVEFFSFLKAPPFSCFAIIVVVVVSLASSLFLFTSALIQKKTHLLLHGLTSWPCSWSMRHLECGGREENGRQRFCC